MLFFFFLLYLSLLLKAVLWKRVQLHQKTWMVFPAQTLVLKITDKKCFLKSSYFTSEKQNQKNSLNNSSYLGYLYPLIRLLLWDNLQKHLFISFDKNRADERHI